MPLHDAQEEMSSLRTPLSCGYSGELLGLEFWARRPSQRIIFLYSQPLKSRGHFPALTELWTKVWCDLALWGAGRRSPGWFWAQWQQQGLPGCQPWHLGARVAEQPWLPWGGRSQPGRGKHHSAMPVRLPHPTEEKQDRAEEPLEGCSATGCLEMLSIISACPAAWLCHPRERPGDLSPDWEGISIPAPNWCCSWQWGWDVRAGGSILHPRCRGATWP